ncbi:probable multidrug resistance-associated protein lethal(2)03659 [Venturia canescens]|uniref:probable multidrug resistance-associated protein lethal(2)03659 n=1 Tax=Venturia canescens TaxID=32260 RepID=UPI001C9D3D58|nr:probable multidrug resistance-associated protein lethal(2)03659 [Venturia canescens]
MDGLMGKERERCPHEKANFFSKLFFWWMKRFLIPGADTDFKMENIFHPLENDRTDRISDQLEIAWERESKRNSERWSGVEGHKRSSSTKLGYALISVFWLDHLKCGARIFLTNVALRGIQPILVAGIIDYFRVSGSGTGTSKNVAFLYGAILVSTSILIAVINHHTYLGMSRVGMRARVACSSLIYKKMLRLNKSAVSRTTPAEILQLFNHDLNRFDVLGSLAHRLWILPIQAIVFGGCLYVTTGPMTLVGFGMLLIFVVPFKFVINRYIKRQARQITHFSNRRTEFMDELINGIRVVKMYAWENPFARMISSARNSEMRAIRRVNYSRASSLAISMFSAKITIFAALVSYVLVGNNLTARVTFTVALYYSFLSDSALGFPLAILQTQEIAASLKKLQSFLTLDELRPASFVPEKGRERDSLNESHSSILSAYGIGRLPQIVETGESDEESSIVEAVYSCRRAFVKMNKLSADRGRGEWPLCDVSFEVDEGELCALVGRAGSGKTALLHVLLGELPIDKGHLCIGTKGVTNCDNFRQKFRRLRDTPNIVISYASQDRWLFAGTIRDNIVFGQAWESEKFRKITKACALSKDVRKWPRGYSTVVGERGIALSPSQISRINLARALYKNAELYLLDDPLSGLDIHLQQRLFDQCISGYLNGKTRILVTHQPRHLQSADTVVLIDRGLVKGQGSFEFLSESNSDFIRLLKVLRQPCYDENNRSENIANDRSGEETELEEFEFFESLSPIDSASMDWSGRNSLGSRTSIESSRTSMPGRISWRVWFHFLVAGSSLFGMTVLIGILITAQTLLTATDYWMSYWSNLETARRSLCEGSRILEKNKYREFTNDTIFSYFALLDEEGFLRRESAVYFYTFLVCCSVVFYLARNFHLTSICARASSRIHDEMFEKILRATMRFFKVNEPGHIVCKFSNDVSTMDTSLPDVLLEVNRAGLLTIGAFVTVAVTNPWMILPMLILFPIFYCLMKCYFRFSRGIKSLEDDCRSAIITQINATLEGLTTIRNSDPGVREILRRQFDSYLDIHSGTWFLKSAADAAFSMWLDLFICIFIACACFIPILLDHGDVFDGTVGLAIWQSLQLPGLLQNGLKQWIEACGYVTAVETILQYSDVKSEGSQVLDDPLPSNWPMKGRLTMKNVFLRYNENTLPSIKDVNLTIESGWKLGIIESPAADKSSLISVILRLENEALSGEIMIDGRDTSRIGLEELRSQISVIPQDSILFSGTLRYNLDPLDRYEDDVLWEALKDVELAHLNLDLPVMKGGANFSVGQRQLVCLARAILKNNRILIIDEATANMEARTDAIIKKVFKTKFARHTVITVSRRLPTVIQSDRILVMSDGKVSEFGCPYELIRLNPGGPFAQMIQETGPMMAERLTGLARAACLEQPAQHSLDLDSLNLLEEGATTDFHED